MASMGWPFSSFFSISTSSLTPSTTICTSSTSEKPRRSALEMSKVPPTAAVSTPPERRETPVTRPSDTARPSGKAKAGSHYTPWPKPLALGVGPRVWAKGCRGIGPKTSH
uniref:Uncharacterized protein n=1 Tax=Gadus morhua TaxID=8049 RepID=A0A8C5BZS5_GADMO